MAAEGLVAFQPKANESHPFAVERLGAAHLVRSGDGRYALKDYEAREVVLRGTWEQVPDLGEGKRVFSIRQLKVLPRLR